jgi:hypothetical protein
MLSSLYSIAVIALGSLAIPLCGAQMATADGSNPAQTVLHVTTTLVLVDVVVTSQGKAVHGLNRNQFHIFENGREQRITSFDEH